MGYYDSEANVENYIQMADGCDGKLLIDALAAYLPEGATALELGMGPGKDLLMLNERWQAVGSDSSAIFIDRFRRLHPNMDVELLDAITIDTDKRYDGIYSNKALYHLSRDELRASFERQAQVLKTGGIALHSFWHGSEAYTDKGLHFAYYCEAALKALIGPEYDILETQRYTEAETDDSFYIVLCKR